MSLRSWSRLCASLSTVVWLLFLSCTTFAEQPQALRVAVKEPWHHLNPMNPPTLTSYRVQDLLYDRLVYWDPNKQDFTHGLIYNLKFDPDRRYLDVKLHPRRTCSGQRLQTSDVLWSFEVLTSEDSPVYRRLLRAIHRFEVKPNEVLRIHFEKGRYEEIQMALTSMRVFAKPTKTPVEKLEGFGPYCLQSSSEWSLLLKRNHDNLAPYAFDKIEFRLVGEPAAQHLLLGKNEIDVTDFTLEKGLIEKSDSKSVHNVKGPRYELRVQMNLRDPQLKEKSVRMDLANSIDLQWIKKSLFEGQTVILQPPQKKSASLSENLKPLDLSTVAKRDLRDILKQQIYYHEEALAPFLTTWQTQARAHGFMLSLNQLTLAQANQIRKEGRFQLYAYLTEVSPEVSAALWHSGGAFNSSGYKSEAADKIFAQLANTLKPKKRRELHKKLFNLLDEDAAELRFLTDIPAIARARSTLDTTQGSPVGHWFFANWRWK